MLNLSICSATLHLSNIALTCDLVTEMDLIIDFDIINNLREFSREHLQRVELANSLDAYSSCHLVLFNFWLTTNVLILRPISPKHVWFLNFLVSNTPVHFYFTCTHSRPNANISSYQAFSSLSHVRLKHLLKVVDQFRRLSITYHIFYILFYISVDASLILQDYARCIKAKVL